MLQITSSVLVLLTCLVELNARGSLNSFEFSHAHDVHKQAANANDGGAFGSWGMDSDNMPYFSYELNQNSVGGANVASTYFNAARQPQSEWRNKTDNLFEIGNDRLVVIASSFGYVQVRQDELGPKFLQDVNPPASQFGGGIVYVVETSSRNIVASSWYSGQAGMNRTFGIGYVQQHVISDGIKFEHDLFTPFGDDPVVISTVTLENLGSSPRNLSVIEVWGTQMLQQQQCSKQGVGCKLSDWRTFQLNNYVTKASITGVGSETLLMSQTIAQNMHPVQPSHWDTHPPVTFLSAIPDAHTRSTEPIWGCDAKAFYGVGGPAQPDLKVPPCASSSDHGALVVERPLQLQPSSRISVHQLYGYIPSGFSMHGLISKYTNSSVVEKIRQQHGPTWRRNIVTFDSPKYPWLSREVAWHGGYLRQALTHYDFFNESMLDQGSQYRYADGFEGATRDPLQHALPLIHSAPEKAASVLRMTLQQLVPPSAWGPAMPAGPYANKDAWNAPYALYGSGLVDTINYIGEDMSGASDTELYLLFLFSEYMLATKDVEFLKARIPYRFKLDSAVRPDRSVLEVVAASFEYLANHTGIGQHGLIRVQSGDWNDGFSTIAGCGGNAKCRQQVQAEGESVMNSAMATYILDRFAQALELAKVDVRVIDPLVVRRFVRAQVEALQRSAWTGSFLSRAWLPNKGFVGTGQKHDPVGITLEPQPWALLSGFLNSSQEEMLVQAVSALDTRIGWKQSGPGHAWFALNHPMVMGLAKLNRTLAWQHWKKLSLRSQATQFPKFWPGVWSSADYIRPESGMSGGGGFPLLNTHRHAWPLYSLVTSLIGLDFVADGLRIYPDVPTELGPFQFRSHLADVSRNEIGEFFGLFRVIYQSARCNVEVELPVDETTSVLHEASMRVQGGTWTKGIRKLQVSHGREVVRFHFQYTGVCVQGRAIDWRLLRNTTAILI